MLWYFYLDDDTISVQCLHHPVVKEAYFRVCWLYAGVGCEGGATETPVSNHHHLLQRHILDILGLGEVSALALDPDHHADLHLLHGPGGDADGDRGVVQVYVVQRTQI